MGNNEHAKKSLSTWATILGIVGMFLIIVPFTTLGIFQHLYILIIGLLLYVSSFIFSINALVKKERTIMKFSPFVLLVPFVILILSIGPMIGLGII